MTDPAALPLRDIHLPEAALWWPPAPGWWLAAALPMLAAVALWFLRRRRERLRRAALYLARREFAAIERRFEREQDAKSTVQAVSVLLRRLAISLFPRRDSAGLAGRAWLEFLDRRGGRALFAADAGQILLDAPYRREVEARQARAVLDLCRQWMEAVAGRGESA